MEQKWVELDCERCRNGQSWTARGTKIDGTGLGEEQKWPGAGLGEKQKLVEPDWEWIKWEELDW